MPSLHQNKGTTQQGGMNHEPPRSIEKQEPRNGRHLNPPHCIGKKEEGLLAVSGKRRTAQRGRDVPRCSENDAKGEACPSLHRKKEITQWEGIPTPITFRVH